MNPTETIQYLSQQGALCANRARESQTEVAILTYATRADIYYTLAAALAILFSSPAPKVSGTLGDADDKARAVSPGEVEPAGAAPVAPGDAPTPAIYRQYASPDFGTYSPGDGLMPADGAKPPINDSIPY